MTGMDLRDVYRNIPRRYESTNHLLTFGLDIICRRIAAGAAAGAAAITAGNGGGTWLDLCSGTGETALLLSRRAPAGTVVISADFSVPMLREGVRRRGEEILIPAAASADALPFPDGTFDIVTVTFAARNLRIHGGLFSGSLREIRRVLRPGGIFVNLETSQPSAAPVRSILHAYAGVVVGWLGKTLTGEREGYAYLSGSIRSFPGPGELASEMEDAGFREVTWKKLMFGVVAIHTATA
jgi:demethylmenaquinone methyltransferase/2-methoxy-6-polyprenyl-1,4-benzoquinol methylase